MKENHKSIEEVQQYVMTHFHVRKLNFYQDLSPEDVQNTIMNIEQIIIDHHLDIRLPDPIPVWVLEIMRDDKSVDYYRVWDDTNYGMSLPPPILIILQPETEYIDCNHYVLARELLLLQGVTRSDIEKKSLRYISYLSLLERGSD